MDKITKKLRGIVVSDKMLKTVVVAVTRLKEQPKYKKQYKVTKRYKAHDEKGEFKVGDKVVIAKIRPLSKDKHWRVIERIATGKKRIDIDSEDDNTPVEGKS